MMKYAVINAYFNEIEASNEMTLEELEEWSDYIYVEIGNKQHMNIVTFQKDGLAKVTILTPAETRNLARISSKNIASEVI